MDVAVVVKQVPAVDAMALTADGRLLRADVPLEMNAFCRRALAMGVALASASGGRCTAVTLGPPAADDVLREAVAGGADDAVHVVDPAFAGSDTLATAQALAATLRRLAPVDLVLAGRSSVDADTGQVPPELAELLGLPFVGAARELTVVDEGRALEIRSERDDGWRRVRVGLPAVVSAAERLTDPVKRPPEARAAVAPHRIRRLAAAELGPGPWGQDASPTWVGKVRAISVDRVGRRLTGPVHEQVREAVAFLVARGALPMAESPVAEHAGPRLVGAVPSWHADSAHATTGQAPLAGRTRPAIAVLVEPGPGAVAREVLGEAAELAVSIGGRVLAVGPEPGDPATLSSWGADEVVTVSGCAVEEDVAAALARQWATGPPWAVLAPATAWGREVAGRLAARLGAGLTGDAVGLGVSEGRLVCAKPALGGQLVAEVTARGVPQMATVRPGVLVRRRPRPPEAVPTALVAGAAAGRLEVLQTGREDDDVTALAAADAVVCVGQGVPPGAYPALQPLLTALGAALGGTRKVTDKGWLPRSRQIGVTGHSVAPALLVLLGVGGSANHMVSSRGAGTIVAVNRDPDAAVFGWADVGLVASWEEVVPALTAAVAEDGSSQRGRPARPVS